MDAPNLAWMTLANRLLLADCNHQVRFIQEDYYLERSDQGVDRT